MSNKKTPILLMNLKTILINPLKFYDLEVAPVVFIFILFFNFLSAFFPDSLMNNTIFITIYNVISILVMYIASSIYLFTYLKVKNGDKASSKDIFMFIRKQSVKVVLATLLYGGMIFAILFLSIVIQVQPILLLVSIGLLVLAFILYIMFAFVICFIVEQDLGVIDAFKSSKRVTSGRKKEISLVILLFNIIIFVPLFFVFSIALSSRNTLIGSFIISFAATITTLMQQRLLAEIYLLIKKE